MRSVCLLCWSRGGFWGAGVDRGWDWTWTYGEGLKSWLWGDAGWEECRLGIRVSENRAFESIEAVGSVETIRRIENVARASMSMNTVFGS